MNRRDFLKKSVRVVVGTAASGTPILFTSCQDQFYGGNDEDAVYDCIQSLREAGYSAKLIGGHSEDNFKYSDICMNGTNDLCGDPDDIDYYVSGYDAKKGVYYVKKSIQTIDKLFAKAIEVPSIGFQQSKDNLINKLQHENDSLKTIIKKQQQGPSL